MRATQQDGSYPRPMMIRRQWASLDGSWAFAHDDADEGLDQGWFAPGAADRFHATIEVPYPPESPASGIGDRRFHPVVWYRCTVPHELLVPPGGPVGRRVLVHFGAVDHRAQVWLDGQAVTRHVGGQTPFSADVTHLLASGQGDHVLVVRAQDDPVDVEQPRGKQDWREKAHGIWYERTTGIWQSVWAETVPATSISELSWVPELTRGSVRGTIGLTGPLRAGLTVRVRARLGDEILADQSTLAHGRSTTIDLRIPALRNGQERARLLWTPENPVLLDIDLTLQDLGTGEVLDEVAGYTGLRSVGVGRGAFLLNEQPYHVRAVLDQGYRPQTHWASTGSAELRSEVELIRAMGFNAVRTHQKAEDPRFLHWADRLGLLVWAETAAAYEFSPTAVELLTREWLELVRRDRSHPCIMAWVPVNESWGVQDIAADPAAQHYAQGLAGLTRALDPSRPVISNDGWEHVDSDILGLHDYSTDPAVLRAHYADRARVVDDLERGRGPAGRRPILREAQLRKYVAGDAPLMISEFGGVSLTDDGDAWGYTHVSSDSEYSALLMGLFDALRASPVVAGFCYTQFMDTGQETNGLLFADGTPKLPLEVLRHIVTGIKDGNAPGPGSTFGWQG